MRLAATGPLRAAAGSRQPGCRRRTRRAAGSAAAPTAGCESRRADERRGHGERSRRGQVETRGAMSRNPTTSPSLRHCGLPHRNCEVARADSAAASTLHHHVMESSSRQRSMSAKMPRLRSCFSRHTRVTAVGIRRRLGRGLGRTWDVGRRSGRVASGSGRVLMRIRSDGNTERNDAAAPRGARLRRRRGHQLRVRSASRRRSRGSSAARRASASARWRRLQSQSPVASAISAARPRANGPRDSRRRAPALVGEACCRCA
jgi:hypothetical protein